MKNLINRALAVEKRLFLLLAAVMMAAGTMATEYVGSLQMASGYTLEDVRVSMDEQGNMTLYRVKFARMMPVRVNVVIPQINCNGEHITGDSIIPLVSDKPKPERIITNLQGTADKQSIDFTCLIGGKEMHYKGTIHASR